jgi:hypothetical protein
MTAARANHTATLLRDGQVLIAGGVSGSSFHALASAELYDPASGAFTPTGDITTARAQHTATLGADGKVLIAGGYQSTRDGRGEPYIYSAEIYDPSTGTFKATGNMLSSGFRRSSILLPNGRVFIAEDGNAEIYDPATGTFGLTGPYSMPGVQVDTGTLLQDGTILVVGCAARCTVGTSELFNPGSGNGTFSATGQPRLWWTVDTATVLLDGTVLFVEGNEDGFPDDIEIYDPASGGFSHIGNTRSVHEFSTATRLPDGRVLIAGGQQEGGGSPAVELYVPATGIVAPGVSMTTGRHNHTATLLADGTVLIAGGYITWPTPTASAEIYR